MTRSTRSGSAALALVGALLAACAAQADVAADGIPGQGLPFLGYGPARLGMTRDELRAAIPAAVDKGSGLLWTPAHPPGKRERVLFQFDEGRLNQVFVRFLDDETDPGTLARRYLERQAALEQMHGPGAGSGGEASPDAAALSLLLQSPGTSTRHAWSGPGWTIEHAAFNDQSTGLQHSILYHTPPRVRAVVGTAVEPPPGPNADGERLAASERGSDEGQVFRDEDTTPFDPDVDEDVTEPQIVHQVAPRYPPDARDDGAQGVVILRAIIDREGRVTGTETVRSPDTRLTEAAIAAVRQWKFKPGHIRGRPVRVVFTLTVNFVTRGRP